MIDTIDRRTLLALAGLAGAAAAIPASGQAVDAAGTEHMRAMTAVPTDAPTVNLLIHPRMVLQDLVGPLTVLNILRCRTHLVWKDKQPCTTDVGIPILATQTFVEADPSPDVLMVPGGILGTIDCMNDPSVMAFLARQGARARWITSVCTGGLTIAAAGLLQGYDATAHWAVADLLPLMGARHVDRRVVVDRNRMTAGGVTAGIDLGLTLAARLRGDEAARSVQLTMEYSPAPPFQSGTPMEAGPALVAAARSRRMWMDGQALVAAKAAGRRLVGHNTIPRLGGAES